MSKDKHKKAAGADLAKQAEEYLKGWQRAQADYINLEKEIEAKRAGWIKMANGELLVELLPVYDNLKLAMKHIPDKDRKLDWVVGVAHIKNQMAKFLADQGVEEIKPKAGDKFDLELHEAVEKSGDEDDTVKKLVKAGYRLKGQVLAPAKVII